MSKLNCDDWGLLEFLDKVYARENPNIVGGRKATLIDYRIQVRTLQKFFDSEQGGPQGLVPVVYFHTSPIRHLPGIAKNLCYYLHRFLHVS